MKKWVLEKAKVEDPFPYIVQILNDDQQVVHHAEESWPTEIQAMSRARTLNEVGHNVRVLRELAFCVNKAE